MEWTIVVEALTTTLCVTMRARYRFKNVAAIVEAWRPAGGFDLPAAIRALQPGHPSTPTPDKLSGT